MHNNLSYNISGSVTDREQSKDDINEVKSLVESMIQTVRSTW